MLELRIRACHVTGSFVAKDNRAGASFGTQPPPRPAALRLRAPRPSAGDLRARAAQGREPDAGGAGLHPRAQAQRGRPGRPRRGRHHRHGRPDQRPVCARWSGSASPMPSAPRGCRCWCSMSSIRWCRKSCARFCAGKRAVLVVEEGHPDYIEQAVNVELRRADIADPGLRQGAAPQGRRVHRRRAARRPRGIPRRRSAGRHRCRRHRRTSARHSRPPHARGRGSRRVAGAAARVLHGLPGTPGVQCAQARAARARPDPHQRRHRLPFVRDHAAVQHGQLDPRLRHVARERRRGRSEYDEAPDRGDGRRRLLAQRAHHRRRQQPLQQGRRRARRHAERLHLGDRPAVHAVEPGRP